MTTEDDVLRMRQERLMEMSEKLLNLMDYAESQVERFKVILTSRDDPVASFCAVVVCLVVCLVPLQIWFYVLILSWPISQFLRSDLPSKINNFFKRLPPTNEELDLPSKINNYFTRLPPTNEELMSS
ncbi:Phosphoribosyltransferase C-terminal [Arabidopsis thaliana x Arabidopsis arenosa]|uniref:Phosphoribosyltransferase C-terminal n=1 Tax=Arabidopsis thaliana x Arabidopsis arenosa TaxID=1240361 RepID=A0A8T1ZQC1_9BRAS|nr:Phosphoribosyltransferase C-terminal [Arabidopsis thaliana x Arabidopsis arenosa]